MVKKPDDTDVAPLIDHVGVRLWRLSRLWKQEFDAAMRARGYPWMAEARGGVVGHLRPGGRSQVALATALGISKQAVQQHVDELAAEGVVRRIADPGDRRGKLVVLTAKGAQALAEGNDEKRRIERRYRETLGDARFETLMAALEMLGGHGRP